MPVHFTNAPGLSTAKMLCVQARRDYLLGKIADIISKKYHRARGLVRQNSLRTANSKVRGPWF